MIGKVSPKRLPKAEVEAMRDDLLHAFQRMGSPGSASLMLDLLTESEWIMVARRLQITKHLIAGESVLEVQNRLQTGQATVESVDRWLRMQFPTYKNVLPTLYEDMLRHAREDRGKRPYFPESFRAVRKRYPLHFLLFNLLLDDIEHHRKDPPPHAYKPSRD